MLHIATVHFQTPKWIDIQREYLDHNITVPFRMYGALHKIPVAYHSQFDYVVEAQGNHEGKLNLLANEISAQADPSDIIIFIDGDAFPIADPLPTIDAGLEHTSLVAVRRDENNGDRQPHPCFCAIRVRDWERLHGDWSPGHTWTDSIGQEVTDVGGNLLRSLERNGEQWTPLLRSNRRNDHPLWFGVYGDVVYHHGAGFRRPFARVDETSGPRSLRGSRLPLVGERITAMNKVRRRTWVETVHTQNEELGDEWFELLKSDPKFYVKLID